MPINLLIIAVVCLLGSRAADVNLDWSVDWVQNVNLDGRSNRRAIGINGQYPPPIINVNQTDSLTINYVNGFQDGRATSLHSHGMFFNNTGYYDGAVSVTQCPIPVGSSITYEPLNSPNSPAQRQMQWGTYWTHGHYSGQYVDGLRTPSIIHADLEPHAYDDDYTIILADWYHREHDDLLKNEFINVKNPTGAEPVPDSGLVYFAHTPKYGQAAYLPGFNENTTLTFEAGKTYRLRLINMAALSMFHVWIEGHDMRIIEADGTDTEEMPVKVVSLAVAQRYSVLVTARNDTSLNWPLHVNLDPEMYDQVPDTLQLNITSTINYAAGNQLGSDRPTIDYEYFDDTALVPVIVEPQLAGLTQSHDLTVDFTTYADGKNYASFNGISFVSAMTPTLFTALSMPSNESGLAQVYGPRSNAVVVPHMDTFDLRIVNLDAGNHPFHLHGYKFQLVHKTTDVTSTDPLVNPSLQEGQANPMRRDTVQIPSGGSATLRVKADNPGAWFLHCHIDWHLSVGLAALVITSPGEFMNNITVPQGMLQQCQAQGLPYSGNAGGLQSLTDFGTLSRGPTPLEAGWTAKAVGTFVACLVTCLLGMATICWYGFASSNVEEEDDDQRENHVDQLATPDAQDVEESAVTVQRGL